MLGTTGVCFQQGQPLTQARQHLQVSRIQELLEESSYTRAGHMGCWKELSSLVWAAQEQPGSEHGSLKEQQGLQQLQLSPGDLRRTGLGTARSSQ